MRRTHAVGTAHAVHAARIERAEGFRITYADLRNLLDKAEAMGAPWSAVFAPEARYIEIVWTEG